MKAKKVEVHLKIQFLFFYKTNIWLNPFYPQESWNLKLREKKPQMSFYSIVKDK